jgi:hypothetical protein
MLVIANRYPKSNYKISLGTKPHDLSKALKNRSSLGIPRPS